MARIEIRLDDVRKTEWQERAADLNVTLTDFIVASIDNVPLKNASEAKLIHGFCDKQHRLAITSINLHAG